VNFLEKLIAVAEDHEQPSMADNPLIPLLLTE
jgi:hypothetical protein